MTWLAVLAGMRFNLDSLTGELGIGSRLRFAGELGLREDMEESCYGVDKGDRVQMELSLDWSLAIL